METIILSTAAKNLIAGFRNNDDNLAVLENWKTLAASLNQFKTYAEIPYLPDVPLAMYMYVMQYSSKRGEENSIRAVTTFGVLMNAISHTEGSDKLDYLVLLSSLITYYKKHFNNVNNYSIFPITVPNVKEEFNQTLIDYGNTTAYINSILLYIYNLVNDEKQFFFGYDEIKNRFVSNKESFFNEYGQNQNDIVEAIDGERTLQDCYNRMNQTGKCPIYVPLSSNTEIYGKTYGLIPDRLRFNVTKYFLQETSGTMSEGESNSQIIIDIQDGMMNLLNDGINDQYLRNDIYLPIRDCFVEKIRQHIEMSFDTRKAYRDDSHKYGNVDNVPTSIDLHFEHFRMTQIVLTFIVGDSGWMRTIHLYGE